MIVKDDPKYFYELIVCEDSDKNGNCFTNGEQYYIEELNEYQKYDTCINGFIYLIDDMIKVKRYSDHQIKLWVKKMYWLLKKMGFYANTISSIDTKNLNRYKKAIYHIRSKVLKKLLNKRFSDCSKTGIILFNLKLHKNTKYKENLIEKVIKDDSTYLMYAEK